jgi:hypothetical protein
MMVLPPLSPAKSERGLILKKKGGNGYGKGTFIDTELFLSDAYLSLGQTGSSPAVSSVSVQLLTMLLGKRQFGDSKDKGAKRKVRKDDNRFTLTYKEVQGYGSRLNKKGELVKGMITQPQVTRGIDELLHKGFIEVIEYGGAFEKHKTVYGLSVEWRTWRWGNPPVRVRQKDMRRGGVGFRGAGKGAVNRSSHTHA